MTIASALDKLNDKLAGSDQPASQTIEGMILRLIDNIDAGGGGSIPIASADTLGGIKVGENLSITEGGVLSASGGGGGALIVHGDENGVLDATLTEIYTAMQTGFVALLMDISEFEHIQLYIGTLSLYPGEGGSVTFGFDANSNTFATDDENDYPVWVDPESGD